MWSCVDYKPYKPLPTLELDLGVGLVPLSSSPLLFSLLLSSLLFSLPSLALPFSPLPFCLPPPSSPLPSSLPPSLPLLSSAPLSSQAPLLDLLTLCLSASTSEVCSPHSPDQLFLSLSISSPSC
ncbi:hypothetical protein V8G54_021249, partial [Vigna mungo]